MGLHDTAVWPDYTLFKGIPFVSGATLCEGRRIVSHYNHILIDLRCVFKWQTPARDIHRFPPIISIWKITAALPAVLGNPPVTDWCTSSYIRSCSENVGIRTLRIHFPPQQVVQCLGQVLPCWLKRQPELEPPMSVTWNNVELDSSFKSSLVVFKNWKVNASLRSLLGR